MTLPPLLDRAALVEHGALLNTAIVRWAAELGLPPPQHHESLGYTGPFIEDHFRERFFLPLRHALTKRMGTTFRFLLSLSMNFPFVSASMGMRA
jgi:hypothetical protein